MPRALEEVCLAVDGFETGLRKRAMRVQPQLRAGTGGSVRIPSRSPRETVQKSALRKGDARRQDRQHVVVVEPHENDARKRHAQPEPETEAVDPLLLVTERTLGEFLDALHLAHYAADLKRAGYTFVSDLQGLSAEEFDAEMKQTVPMLLPERRRLAKALALGIGDVSSRGSTPPSYRGTFTLYDPRRHGEDSDPLPVGPSAVVHGYVLASASASASASANGASTDRRPSGTASAYHRPTMLPPKLLPVVPGSERSESSVPPR